MSWPHKLNFVAALNGSTPKVKGARDGPRPLHLRAFRIASTNGNLDRVVFFCRGTGMIGFAVGGEGSAAHIVAIAADGFGNSLAEIGVLAREFRRLVESEPEQIVDDEDLTVAVRSSADADGGNTQLACDFRGEFARHGFEDDGESAG